MSAQDPSETTGHDVELDPVASDPTLIIQLISSHEGFGSSAVEAPMNSQNSSNSAVELVSQRPEDRDAPRRQLPNEVGHGNAAKSSGETISEPETRKTS
jgi:hypothetical protein